MQLIINGLSKTYANGVRALKDVSLTLGNGMFGLLGPNGAGKSSLMRTIATLQEADTGVISLQGIDGAGPAGSYGSDGMERLHAESGSGSLDMLKDKTRVRQLLGYLPQEFGVYPRIPAEQMLDHIARLKGITNAQQRKELVDALLDNVNLYKDKKKSLGTFSGGMKQRFGIAQALIGNPKLIIVDEPTAGLDPAERNRFYNLLSHLGENTIVILSTHIVEDVSTLCSRFAIICQGEVLYSGEPDTAVSELEGKIYSLSIPKESILRYRERFGVISTQLKAGRLYIRIIQDTDPGEGFQPAAPNLEDVYFSNIATKVDVNMI
ncbi:MAG TPA: ABC transporter ATP-binding protein [Puia sp.]|nr:ABC transporter ATP-binding protein [Puia sp.]